MLADMQRAYDEAVPDRTLTFSHRLYAQMLGAFIKMGLYEQNVK
jgi:hypothetical protein